MALELAEAVGNASQVCRELGIPRRTFYHWKRRFVLEGESGLANRRPGPKNHPWSTPPEVVEKIVHLRSNYHFGPQRITWYLARYHGIELSCSTVYRTLIRQGMRRLPRTVGRRVIHSRRDA